MTPRQTNDSIEWMLVVEDQMDLWVLIQQTLRRKLPQVRLVHVSQVIDALAELQHCLTKDQPLPRLILSNLYLPRREEGIHLLKAIKSAHSGLSHLPVVIMSSSTQAQDRQAVNQAGSAYLQKPTTAQEWDEFVRTVQHYWQHSGPQRKQLTDEDA